MINLSHPLDVKSSSKYRAENDPGGHNYYLRDAAGATSAAPTFFTPKVTKAPNGNLFHDVDGGIFQTRQR